MKALPQLRSKEIDSRNKRFIIFQLEIKYKNEKKLRNKNSFCFPWAEAAPRQNMRDTEPGTRR